MTIIKDKLTTEQEYVGLCYRIRENARRLLDSAEHSIVLHENKDGIDGHILGESGEQIVTKMMKEWTKWKMGDAMKIVHGIRNFVIDHLKDDIDIYTQRYYSEDKQQSTRKSNKKVMSGESKKLRKREQEQKV
jgi:hypothetical protein